MKPLNVVFNLFVLLVIVGLPYLGWLSNFSYSVPILFLIWVALRVQKQTFGDIAFSISNLNWKSVGIGIGTGAILFVMLQLVFWPSLDAVFHFTGDEPEINTFLKQNIFTFLFILVMSGVVGGGYETIAFHGFMYQKIKELVPVQNAHIISYIVTSLVFALYHYTLGWIGVFNALLAGMVYLGLVLKHKSLWPTIFCHATYNAFVVVCLYLGWI